MNEATIQRLNVGNKSGRMSPTDVTELTKYVSGNKGKLTPQGVNTALYMMRDYLGLPANQAFAQGTENYHIAESLRTAAQSAGA